MDGGMSASVEDGGGRAEFLPTCLRRPECDVDTASLLHVRGASCSGIAEWVGVYIIAAPLPPPRPEEESNVSSSWGGQNQQYDRHDSVGFVMINFISTLHTAAVTNR